MPRATRTTTASANPINRRRFLGAMAATTAATATGFAAPAVLRNRPPNILFINNDQQGIDTLSALGCQHVHTPNMDRLVASGTCFMQSYSVDPVCCPARASWTTGRPPAENGVVLNSVPIVPDMPDLGQWFRQGGYDAVYVGKWHVPNRNLNDSFRVLPGGYGQGELGDGAASRACQAYLLGKSPAEQPFFLTVGFLQPHDICYWIFQHTTDPGSLPYPELAEQLPELPPNFRFDPREPEDFVKSRRRGKPGQSAYEWSELHWRYYLWSYYRHVEMVDAEVGRVLDALEDSPHARNTVVVLSADHGEGRGRHQMVTKGYLYDEAAKVPMLVSWPEQVAAGRDEAHLVSGLDLAPTLCDYAGLPAMPKARGRSLRPLLEGANTSWRDYLVSSSSITGRMVRTPRHKLISYQGSPTVQLFDMANDPWETRNLAGESHVATVLADHHRMLDEWESRLESAPTAAYSRAESTRRAAGSAKRGGRGKRGPKG